MKVLGHGDQAIYVYHYEAYEDSNDMYYYPCKIGMSTTNVLDRIHSQVKTSHPEKPIIDLIVLCENARKLESAIHAILKLYDREINDATGVEWFNTTGDEVKNICSMLHMC